MRLALIGCGKRGSALAAAAVEDGLEVVVCADPAEREACRLAKALGARVTTRPGNVFRRKGIDGVVIATPTSAHAAYARRAVEAGKHVLCAAPLGLELASVRAVVGLAKKNRVALYTAYDTAVCPEFVTMDDRLAALSFGTVGFIRSRRAMPMPRGRDNWYREYSQSGGAIAGLLAQDIAWITQRFGCVKSVFCQAIMRPRLDFALMTLTLEQGPIAQLIASWAEPAGGKVSHSVEVCTPAGMLQFSTDGVPLDFTPRATQSAEISQQSSPVTPSIEVRHMQRFVAKTQSANASTRADLDHELHVVRVIETALTSARSGNNAWL